MDNPPVYAVRLHRRRRIPPLRKGVYLLPTLLTSAGLFSGFYSIICTLNAARAGATRWYWLAAVMILVAQLCDALDGRLARLTRSTSSFGIQYDSLADLVAFGVAPGILVYQWALRPWGRWGWLAASLYVTCGALRLARFNVQIASVEKRYFVGLPIPAAAGVIAATVLLWLWLGGEGETGKHITMLLVIFAVAGLMVSEIRYYSFKEIRFHHRHPFPVRPWACCLAARPRPSEACRVGPSPSREDATGGTNPPVAFLFLGPRAGRFVAPGVFRDELA